MNSQTLRIGLSACFFHADPQRAIFKGKTLQYIEQSIAHWLMSGGARVYMLPMPPAGSPVKLESYVEDFDGLVLEGGSDLWPGSYGETAMKPEWNGDRIRDQYEIALLQAFLAKKKPILGVCRGAQLMNVAFGGTLFQDIETQVKGSLNHRNWEIYDQNFHSMQIKEGGRLARLYGTAPRKTNTIHHQGIKELGKNLVVEAVSPEDGIIEAIRYTGDSYAMAVQWHPEFHDVNDQSLIDDRLLLQDFLNECKKVKESNHA